MRIKIPSTTRAPHDLAILYLVSSATFGITEYRVDAGKWRCDEKPEFHVGKRACISDEMGSRNLLGKRNFVWV